MGTVGRTLGAVVLAMLAAGCLHPQDANLADFDPTPPAPPEATVVRDVEIGGDDSNPPPASEPVLVWSSISIGRSEPVLFRLGAGLGALGHIDLDPCRGQGLAPGYVHMHLTFRHNGHVVRAAVETPTAPPPEALECISEQIEATMVPTFDGGDVMLSRSYFVN